MLEMTALGGILLFGAASKVEQASNPTGGQPVN